MAKEENKKEKIEWCTKGYTVEESKEKCPLGGCWKYRCIYSTYNKEWHEGREKWREERYESGHER